MIALDFLAPVWSFAPEPYNYAGLFFVVPGLWHIVYPAHCFRKVGTAIRPGAVSSLLVTTGPFRYSRNPIYLGMVMALLGVSICFGSISTLLPVLVFAFWIQQRFIRMEEGILAETFGQEYRDYCARVRRWL